MVYVIWGIWLYREIFTELFFEYILIALEILQFFLSYINPTSFSTYFFLSMNVFSNFHIYLILINSFIYYINCQYLFNLPNMILVLKSQFQPHQDQINALEMCERNDRPLIISASSDCSLALWEIYGNRIGVFGQVCNIFQQEYSCLVQLYVCFAGLGGLQALMIPQAIPEDAPLPIWSRIQNNLHFYHEVT